MQLFYGRQCLLRAACYRGLTLVEVLVATVISSLLVLLAVTTLGRSMDAWKDFRAEAGMLSDGRAINLVMRRDFAHRLPDIPVYVAPSIDSLDGLRSNVVSFCTTSDGVVRYADVERGDVAMVVYYAAFTPDYMGKVSPKLFRVWLSPAEVWERMKKEGWDPIFTPDPTMDEASGRAEIVASNVLQFAVTRWGVEDGDNGVDVILRVVESGAASRLKSKQDWSGETSVSDQFFDADGDTHDDAAVRTFRMRFSYRP